MNNAIWGRLYSIIDLIYALQFSIHEVLDAVAEQDTTMHHYLLDIIETVNKTVETVMQPSDATVEKIMQNPEFAVDEWKNLIKEELSEDWDPIAPTETSRVFTIISSTTDDTDLVELDESSGDFVDLEEMASNAIQSMMDDLKTTKLETVQFQSSIQGHATDEPKSAAIFTPSNDLAVTELCIITLMLVILFSVLGYTSHKTRKNLE